MGTTYFLGYGDVGVSIMTAGGPEGTFDTDAVEVTFDAQVGERLVSFGYSGCVGSGSWSGGSSVATLSMAGDIDCSAVVPTARDADTGDDVADELGDVQIAPFAFAWI